MYKETIICIVIVIAIVIGNVLTQNYTKESVEATSYLLNELKEEIKQEEVDQQEAKDKINDIHNQWDERHQKLAYYIEHDELEKVETNLTGVRSNIETAQYEEAVSELEKSIYLLNHIKDKNSLNLQNIF